MPPTLEDIRAQYAVWVRAFQEKNLAGCMAILTPDFCLTLPDGQILRRPEVEQAVSDQMASLVSVSAFDIALELIASQSPQTIVRAFERVDETQRADPGILQNMSLREVYEDIWVHENGLCRLRHSQLRTSETFLDTHLVPAEGGDGRKA